MRRFLSFLLLAGLLAGCAPLPAQPGVTAEAPAGSETTAGAETPANGPAGPPAPAATPSTPPAVPPGGCTYSLAPGPLPAGSNLTVRAPEPGEPLPAPVCDWIQATGNEKVMVAVAEAQAVYLIASAGPGKAVQITELERRGPAAGSDLRVQYQVKEEPGRILPTVLILPDAAQGGEPPALSPEPFMPTVHNWHHLPAPKRLRSAGISIVSPGPGETLPDDVVKVQGFANTWGGTIVLTVRDENGEVLGEIQTEGGGGHEAFGSFVAEVPIQYLPRSESGFVEGLTLHLGGGKHEVTHRVPVRFAAGERARILEPGDLRLGGMGLKSPLGAAQTNLGPPATKQQDGNRETWTYPGVVLTASRGLVDSIGLTEGETPRGVRIGESLARVEELYGPPHRRVESERQLEYVSHLLGARLIVQGDAAGRVAEVRLEETAAPWALSEIEVPPDAYDEPLPGAAAGTAQSRPQAATGTTPGPLCPVLTRESATDLLVRLSRATPEERVALSSGPAQAVFAEEAEYIMEGWPAWPDGLLTAWHQEAWFGLSIASASEPRAAVVLEHGAAGRRVESWFIFTCSGEGWKLAEIHPAFGAFSPSPPPLPGQNGELTPALAQALIEQTIRHYGRPAMRVYATGRELERGRQVALRAAEGLNLFRQDWGGRGSSLRLEPEPTGEALGFWLDQAGQPTGEKLRFVRTGGLWRLADHTEGGEWARVTFPGFETPRGPNEDLDLLGLEVGMSRQEVEELLGAPDRTAGYRLQYSHRDLMVELDQLGQVKRIIARSGATRRKLRIGDPISLAYHLYGPPAQVQDPWLIYEGGRLRLRIRFESDARGTGRVTALVLESRLLPLQPPPLP